MAILELEGLGRFVEGVYVRIGDDFHLQRKGRVDEGTGCSVESNLNRVLKKWGDRVEVEDGEILLEIPKWEENSDSMQAWLIDKSESYDGERSIIIEDWISEAEPILLLPPPSSLWWVLKQVKEINRRLSISFEGMEGGGGSLVKRNREAKRI